MCRGGTLKSAECHPCTLIAEWLRIRFETLRQWWVKFLARIFYSFWAPHSQKLRIGLLDHCTTKWCFWPAHDQNLRSVILRCDHESNFWNFDLERLRTFTPMVPKVSPQDFVPLFGAPWLEITTWSFLPNVAFDWCATKIYVRSFWLLCDWERSQKFATNGGFKKKT